MRNPKPLDFFLLTLLALIWSSAFFNIKIATYSYGPVTIAFLRVFLGAIPLLIICFLKKIKIEAFSKDWLWISHSIISFTSPLVICTNLSYSILKIEFGCPAAANTL